MPLPIDPFDLSCAGISAGGSDGSRAVGKAGTIIAGLKERVSIARISLRRPVKVKADGPTATRPMTLRYRL
jgi:hypothetical protein